MKSFRDTIMDNWPWIIASLLAVGAFTATVRYLGQTTDSNAAAIAYERERVSALEKTMIKADDARVIALEKNVLQMSAIQDDIKDIKEDIRDIRKVIFKPIMGSDETQGDSKISIVRK